MDFVSSLSKTTKGCDSIWFVVDRLANSAHFVSIKINYALQKMVELYIDKVANLCNARGLKWERVM